MEILITNKKINSSKTGSSIKSKKAYLSEGNNISFQNSKILFNSININEDVFDIFILYNNDKVKNTNSNSSNYYRISAKDIGVAENFKELKFIVVNNISLSIKIRIKNKFDESQKISVKDRLKFFNAKVENSKKSEEEFYQKYKRWDDIKSSKEKGINQKDSSKKLVQSNPQRKSIDQTKKTFEPIKSIDQTKKVERVNKPNNNQNTRINNNTTNNAQNKPKVEKKESQNRPPQPNKPKQTPKKAESPKQINSDSKILDKSKTLIPPQINNPKNTTAKAFQKTQGELPPKKEIPTVGEIFIEPTTYGQFCQEQNAKGIKHPYRETFCEGFFIASFPEKNGKVVEMSESFPSPCRHEECSKLPAMKPEIIFRYPLQDTKTLELNNLAATICFPTGIKVCYNEEGGPNIIKDYVTSITNQKGERYYMMTYHFYVKLEIDDYQTSFKI